jgi:hypothetical protein
MATMAILKGASPAGGGGTPFSAQLPSEKPSQTKKGNNHPEEEP